MADDSVRTSLLQIREDGQILFLGSLMVFALLAAVGFSLALFGAASTFMATPTDRLITAGIGVGLMGLGGLGTWLTLR